MPTAIPLLHRLLPLLERLVLRSFPRPFRSHASTLSPLPFRLALAPVILRLQRACPEPFERQTQRPDRSQRTPPPRQPERPSPPSPSQPLRSLPTRRKSAQTVSRQPDPPLGDRAGERQFPPSPPTDSRRRALAQASPQRPTQPSPTRAPRPTHATPRSVRRRAWLGASLAQPKNAPPRLKSFLEKTLIARETPHSALLACLLLAALLTACDPAPTRELRVFAAASLRQALTETADAFQQAHPDVHVVANVAGSQVLRFQIESGARADLVISANPDHLDALQQAGLLAASPTVVATNQLVLAVPAANPAGLTGLQDLAQPNRRVVMAGQSVPAGAYARQMLALHAAATGQSGFADSVLGNVISFETNVRQVAAKLELAEADAGFVYRTDVLASHGRLQAIETPPYAQVTARYPAAILRDAANPELAHRFLTFLRTPAAQAILTRHGFSAPA